MLSPWKRSYDQPRQYIKKQRYYFANKSPSSQSYGFSIVHAFHPVMYRCESWTIKQNKTKQNWMSKNWCFWTVVLEKTLESPLDWREIQRSILKKINPEYSLEGLVLKLKLQYFGHLMQRTDSFEMTLMMGKIEGQRRKGGQRIRWLDGLTNAMDMSLSKLL